MEPIDCLGFDHIDLTVNDLARSTRSYEHDGAASDRYRVGLHRVAIPVARLSKSVQ